MACKDYCVYKHTLPNNKVYIGITKQIPSLRWANGRGYKHSNYFYNAILKYGWLNIRHEILRDCLTIEEANDLEKYYIAFYKANDRKYGYNILEGGDSKTVPEERRVNLTKVKHGKNKSKAVLVFNLNKEYVGEFVSSYQAAKILNCDQGHIRKCCQCKEGRKQHKGYIFKYKEEL